MREASQMCQPLTLKDSRNATSLPASASGVMPLEGLDGQTIMPFGQGVAHVSHSVRAGKGAASQISVISGPHGSGSSASVALTCSLASRLRAKTDLLGSTLFRLIWKERTTPSGRRIYALRASGHPTSGNACTSWPTPLIPNGGRMPKNGMMTTKGQTPDGKKRTVDLGWIAKMATWPTPTSPMLTGGVHQAWNNRYITKCARLSSWATPTARDGTSEHGSLAMMKRRTDRPQGKPLSKQALLTDSGKTPTGSTARTENTGQLNPAHSRWLMGLPPEWDACAVTAMASVRLRRKPSSKRTEKSGESIHD